MLSGEHPNSKQPAVELAVILLAALVVSICVGVLSWIGGMAVAMSVLAGAGAFVTCSLFLIALIKFLRR